MRIIKASVILLLFISFKVCAAGIDVKGPRLIEVNKEYIYTIKVSDFEKNGDLKVYVPGHFKVVGVSKKGRVERSSDKKSFVITFSGDSIKSKPADEVKIKISPVKVEKENNRIRAGILRDSKTIEEGFTEFKIIGIADIQVDIYDTEDPVEVGKETTYVIEVANKGSAAATNIKTGFVVSGQCAITSIKAPEAIKFQQDGQTVGFMSAPILNANKKLVYRVTCKAGIEGSSPATAFVTYDQNEYPVSEVENTSIYE